MLVHHHLVIRANVNKPPIDPEYIDTWMCTLIKDIGMNILMGPYSVYSEMIGNRGLTSVAVIETSNICLHCWDEESPGVLQLDVYSCSEFSIETVFKAMQEFEPIHIDYKFLDRTNDFIENIS